MRLKLICAVLAGLLLVVAPGCGSKKKSESTTTKATTSTTAAGGGVLSASDCANLIAAEQTFVNVTKGNVPKDINQQLAQAKALAAVAPDAIKGDLAVLGEAGAAYAKLGIKQGQQPTAAQIQGLLATLDVPALSKALTHLGTWASKNCATP
jgi:ABC-type glycerol-3-phosphate transport system substrate-binding protein